MPEWWTYGLSDIVMFSRETYYRLFELYNRAVWPAPLVAVAAGLLILALLLRRADSGAARLVAAMLAAAWLWTAIAFHLKRYATIHWAARWFGAAFVLEAILLGMAAIRGRLTLAGEGLRRRGAVGIFLFALTVQPLAGLVFGREWRQIELFGIAPDPTAAGTLGILLLAAGRVRWELAGIPLLWCAVSGVMLLAMEAPDAWITFAPGAAAVLLLISVRVAGGRGSSRSRRSPESRAL